MAMVIRIRTICRIAIALAILMPAPMLLTGCSWLRGACSSAVPYITKTQAYVHDAQLAIDRVETQLALLQLPEDVKHKVTEYIARAKDIIRGADRALALGADACSKPDPFVLLKDLLDLWPAIETLLAPYDQKLGAAPGGGKLSAPLIVLEHRARAGK